MALNEFVNIPATATIGGAPIDAFQADAFRQNDALFHKLFLAILSSPLVPNGKDGAIDNPPEHRLVNATQINVTAGSTIELKPKVPLIWMATESITIEGTIDAKGKGAQNGEKGDFGGSGGGDGSADGEATQTPITNVPIAPGGGINSNGQNLDPDWATRALAFLPLCKGGASGAGDGGGAGGGVVFLCAPTITISGAGMIDAQGEPGAPAGGGGGGGLVILIGNNITVDDGVNVRYGGGKGEGGSAGDGGQGLLLERDFN